MMDVTGNSSKEKELSSGKADRNSCGRELDDESIADLVGFFSLLDKWNTESAKRVTSGAEHYDSRLV
jgi:hypothetical protein